MKVLFVAPLYVNIDSSTGGVFNEMLERERALSLVGVKVEYLSLDKTPHWDDFDLCHLFMANEGSYGFAEKIKDKLPLIVTPIIDRTQSNLFLKTSILIMKKVPLMTNNILRSLDVCSISSGIMARSNEEALRIKYAYGLDNLTEVIRIPYERETVEQIEKVEQVLFIGDIGNPRKNIIRLIKACNTLNVKLKIAGIKTDGAYGDKVLREIECSFNTTYLGKVSEEEKLDLLRESKVFCLPSLMEGVGISAIEANKSGANVVISNKGGAVDYLDTNTWFVNPKSLKDITDAIRQALNSKKTIPSNINLTYRFIGNQMLSFYRGVCDKK